MGQAAWLLVLSWLCGSSTDVIVGSSRRSANYSEPTGIRSSRGRPTGQSSSIRRSAPTVESFLKRAGQYSALLSVDVGIRITTVPLAGGNATADRRLQRGGGGAPTKQAGQKIGESVESLPIGVVARGPGPPAGASLFAGPSSEGCTVRSPVALDS
ncbi:hypothetical protein CDD83_3320 [Cordyceps sp. RAO-2017]|nr:hypothetical protein CDD83_3320 [Cordyceps sp. RAO-2017]